MRDLSEQRWCGGQDNRGRSFAPGTVGPGLGDPCTKHRGLTDFHWRNPDQPEAVSLPTVEHLVSADQFSDIPRRDRVASQDRRALSLLQNEMLPVIRHAAEPGCWGVAQGTPSLRHHDGRAIDQVRADARDLYHSSVAAISVGIGVIEQKLQRALASVAEPDDHDVDMGWAACLT